MVLIRVQARTKMVKGYLSCMRGTWLGNPFPLTKYTLEDSLSLYERYLTWRVNTDVVFQNYLFNLGEKAIKEDVTLGCTCKPDAKCHVDILIKFISSMIYGKQKTKDKPDDYRT